MLFMDLGTNVSWSCAPKTCQKLVMCFDFCSIFIGDTFSYKNVLTLYLSRLRALLWKLWTVVGIVDEEWKHASVSREGHRWEERGKEGEKGGEKGGKEKEGRYTMARSNVVRTEKNMMRAPTRVVGLLLVIFKRGMIGKKFLFGSSG